MVQTRNRGRSSRTPATTKTTSTSVSPLLGDTKSVEPDTPDTSEPELVLEKKTVSSTTITTRSARKRAAEDEGDNNVPLKRRAAANAVVVELPPARASKTKARILDLVCNFLTESANL